MITLRSGIRIATQNDSEFCDGTTQEQSWQMIIYDFEQKTGNKVKAVKINNAYGLMFILE